MSIEVTIIGMIMPVKPVNEKKLGKDPITCNVPKESKIIPIVQEWENLP